MFNLYSKTELLDIGFENIGDDVMVSKDARLFAISGTLGKGVRIDAFAIITGHIEFGDNVHISPFCFLGGTGGVITMENNSGLSSHVSIFTKSADYSNDKLENDSKIIGDVYIGENSIVGSGAKIMPRVSIEKNVSIACNCVINNNIEEGSIIVNRGMGLITLSQRGEDGENTI